MSDYKVSTEDNMLWGVVKQEGCDKENPAVYQRGLKLCEELYHINGGSNKICAVSGCGSVRFRTEVIGVGMDGHESKDPSDLVERLASSRIDTPLKGEDLILVLKICGVLYGPNILKQTN